MPDTEKQLVIPWAVRLADDRRPAKLALRLSDGYQTSIYCHRPAEAAPLPKQQPNASNGPRPAGLPPAPGARKLPVLFVHGIQSHPGWFVGSAGHLAELGYPVFQVTRRGSGDNAAHRGHARSARQLLDDVQTACRFVLDRTGAARLHLLGISWGGKLLTAFACRQDRQPPIASLTLAAPGIAAQVDVAPATKIAIALALLVAPWRRFPIPLSDVELFTDNEEMRRYLRDDPCRLMTATARFLYASRRLDRMLQAAPDACLAMPVSLVLACDDRIIDNARTRQALQRLGGANLLVRELPGAHTMDFHDDPRPYYHALAEALARTK